LSSFPGADYSAVLFDLDGTLVDTAPDMVAVLQSLQEEHGLDPVGYQEGRSYVSNGAVGLLRLGFPDRDDAAIEILRLAFLERYADQLCVHSALFAGMETLVDRLDNDGLPWGVVTNKPQHLTDPLLVALGLNQRVACSVSGDTLPLRKPDPAPLHHACQLAALEAARTLYVGDSSRDIDAGRAAGMGTIAAAYGYIAPGDNSASWGADAIANDTQELAQIVLKAVNLRT
jgi:2-phosphoglycolate phosphatase